MRAVELFAGSGGLLLGCALAGFEHDVAVEWDHAACETLRTNVNNGYPLVKGMQVIEGDVREVDWSGLQDKIDLLAGGPPCQPFSLGGLARAALDPRDMFPAYTSILNTLRPRAFIAENVKGLTRASFADYYSYILLRLQHPSVLPTQDETWREHLSRLTKEHTSGMHDDLRYEVSANVVNAADYGVAQQRHRVIIVGFRSDVSADWSFPKPTHSAAALTRAKETGAYWARHGIEPHAADARPRSGDPDLLPWRTCRDALAGLPEPLADGTPSWLNHVLQPGARSYPGHTGSPLDQPAKTIKAGVHGVPGGENMMCFPDGSLRYFSVREAARIQDFPDRYEFAGSWSEAMRQIGNAVPVRLAQVVASSVAVALERDTARKALDQELALLDTPLQRSLA